MFLLPRRRLMQGVRRYPADPNVLSEARSFLRGLTAEVGFSNRTTEEVLLAVMEACNNAIEHSGSAEWRLSWRGFDSCLEFEVEDDGQFRQPLPLPEDTAARGRGMLLMMALMDSVSVRRGTPRDPGSAVRLVKCDPS
jgi:anti-sigma regulatory factor (Ser/Thr protein kinase)